MNCRVCGQRQTETEAAFCGQCGVTLRRPKQESPAEPPDSLAAARLHLAEVLGQSDFVSPEIILELRATAGVQPSAQRATVVVVGDLRRGKSTVINRLLGQEVVSTARRDDARVVRIVGRPREATFDDIETRCCAANILSQFDLVDTPPATPAEDHQVSVAVQQAVSAAGIIVCVDARQALSASERKLLEKELLPLTRCPIVLVVTFLDQVPDPVDQAEVRQRLETYTQRVGDGRVTTMMLAPGHRPTDAVTELVGWIEGLNWSHNCAEVNPADRLRELLLAIEAALPAPTPNERDSPTDHYELALSVLEREHRTAMAQANSMFRQGCSRLRSDLKAVVQAANSNTSGIKAMAYIVHCLRKAAEQASETYASCLREALVGSGPLALRSMGENLNLQGRLAVQPTPRAAPSLPVASPADWQLSGVEGAALGAAVAMPGALSIAGAGIALLVLYNLRRARRRRTEEDCLLETEMVLQQWLSNVEPDYLEALGASAEELLGSIRQRIEEQFGIEDSEPMDDQQGNEIRRAIAYCRQFLEANEEI